MSRQADNIAVLMRRAAHLRQRILSSSDRDLSYDKRELTALEETIAALTREEKEAHGRNDGTRHK